MDKMINKINQVELLNLLVDEQFGAIFICPDINSKATMIYGSFDSIGLNGVESISDILKLIDQKSEITEILGVDEFFMSINKNIEADKGSKIYLPIKRDSETSVYSFRAVKREDANILCYIQLIDSDTLDIERLYADSYKDSLTYLFNKNALDFHLRKNVSYHYIGFIDLDDFKNVNDKYSHHIGNQLLTEIGKKLISVSNQNVIYYRYGGDEFVFMTIDLTYNETIALAYSIQKAMAEIDFLDITPKFSIGISEYNEKSKYTVEDAVKLADFAMYLSKNNGKNKVSYLSAEDGNKILETENVDEILEKYRKIRRNAI